MFEHVYFAEYVARRVGEVDMLEHAGCSAMTLRFTEAARGDTGFGNGDYLTPLYIAHVLGINDIECASFRSDNGGSVGHPPQ